MTLKEKIMKLQTYKMFEGEDTVYVERDDVLKLLEQQTCEDAVDRELVRKEFCNWIMSKKTPNDFLYILGGLPSVTPKFTDTEIQKMQELEQAQLEKTYELGKAEIQPCEDCISRQAVLEKAIIVPIAKVVTEDKVICHKIVFVEDIQNLPSVTSKTDILDKIKVEIDLKQYDFMGNKDYDEGIRFGLMLAYQIIDKYKAESEGEE